MRKTRCMTLVVVEELHLAFQKSSADSNVGCDKDDCKVTTDRGFGTTGLHLLPLFRSSSGIRMPVPPVASAALSSLVAGRVESLL